VTWLTLLFIVNVAMLFLLYLLLTRRDDEQIDRKLRAIYRQGKRSMALAQDILDAVTASRTQQDALSNTVAQLVSTVDQIIASVGALKESGAITAEQAQAIIGTATADRDAAQAANEQAAGANQRLQDTLTKLEG
jgi:hypothetical protein